MITCTQAQARIGTENFSPAQCQSQRQTPRQPSRSAGFAYGTARHSICADRANVLQRSPAAGRKFQFEFAAFWRSGFEAIALTLSTI